jgi:hypothetical protein
MHQPIKYPHRATPNKRRVLKIKEHSHPLPRNNPIRPTPLEIPLRPFLPTHKNPIPINLHAPKDILRLRDPPKIYRLPLITNMHPTSPPRTPRSALPTRPSSSISPGSSSTSRPRHVALLPPPREECSPGPKPRASGGCKRHGLCAHGWVLGGVPGEDGAEEV